MHDTTVDISYRAASSPENTKNWNLFLQTITTGTAEIIEHYVYQAPSIGEFGIWESTDNVVIADQVANCDNFFRGIMLAPGIDRLEAAGSMTIGGRLGSSSLGRNLLFTEVRFGFGGPGGVQPVSRPGGDMDRTLTLSNLWFGYIATYQVAMEIQEPAFDGQLCYLRPCSEFNLFAPRFYEENKGYYTFIPSNIHPKIGVVEMDF